MRIALLVITISLFPLNYFICELFYPDLDEDSINNWNLLRFDILHLMFFLCLLNIEILLKKTDNFDLKKYYQLFLYIGIGLSSSDVIDRWILGNRNFVWTDIIMITIVLITGYRKHLKWNTTTKY